MTVSLDEWRKDAEHEAHCLDFLCKDPVHACARAPDHLRRLIAACKALEAYWDGVRAFRAGDPSSAMFAFADAEDALAEGDKD